MYFSPRIYVGCFSLGLFLLLDPSLVGARWYGDHYVSRSGTATNCDIDSQTDAVAPVSPDFVPMLPGSTGTQYLRQARAITTGNPMLCQYWDSTIPINGTISYYDGWKNSTTIPVTMTASDTGGSGVGGYILEVQSSSNSPSFTSGWSAWTTVANITSTATSYTHSFTGLDGRGYRFRFQSRDRAGNLSAGFRTGVQLYRVDITPPSITQIQSTTAAHLLATNAQNFSFNYTGTGSSVALTSRIESYLTPSAWLTALDGTTYSSTPVSTQNIQNVAQDLVDGGRSYTYQITRICDQAGNCTTAGMPRDFSFRVYANTLQMVGGSAQKSVTNNTLSATTNIADANPKNLTFTLKDIYGNPIIPSSTISRTVDFQFVGENTLYLDQIRRTGGSSVFMTTANTTTPYTASLTLGTFSTLFSSQSSTNGLYTYLFKVYTPTANQNNTPVSDPLAQLRMTGVQYRVNGSLGNHSWQSLGGSTFGTKFSPLYSTRFSGDLRDGGFIEGAVQSSLLRVEKNVSSSNPSFSTQLTWSGTDTNLFDLSYGISTPTPVTLLTPSLPTSLISLSSTPSDISLSTKMIQKSLVTSNSRVSLTSHIQYTLDGHTIAYNSDIVGKSSYWDSTESNIASQVGLKVIGAVSSRGVQHIIGGAGAIDMTQIGSTAKVEFKNALRKSVTEATRGLSLSPVGTTLTSVSTLPSGSTTVQGGAIHHSGQSSVLLLEGNGETITLNASLISGSRTIITRGLNLWIRNDLRYGDVGSDILALVVLNGSNGIGGNIYIDPSITNLVGSYFADGSLLSYNGAELDGNASIVVLKNQLQLFGSLVSENTIGGSRSSPYRCPNLLMSGCTSQAVAQKYDLNFLRRYYLITDPATGARTPFGGAKVIGGGTCSITGTCSGFTPLLYRKFTNTTDDMARYPFIIEYNPRVATHPPVGIPRITQE